MKNLTTLFAFFLLIISLASCNKKIITTTKQVKTYTPEDQALYDAIVAMDKTFFDAYNNCDLTKQADIYSDHIEFFHDKGGLMTSKDAIIEATERNICGKVTRELVEGSIEVYPINGYGAIQMGYHKFHNNQEPDAPSIPSRFITIWQNENGNWKMAKVISLHK